MAIPFGETAEPSDAELRIAQAQLVGWLEGLFHGIQATLFAQQMAARNQLNAAQCGRTRTEVADRRDGLPKIIQKPIDYLRFVF